MILFIKLKDKSGKLVKNTWQKGSLLQITLLSWILIIFILLIFLIGLIPFHKEILKEKLRSEANDIAGSIEQVSAISTKKNDYNFLTNYCSKIIKRNSTILYIVISRNDGFSLLQTADDRKQTTLKDDIYFPGTKKAKNEFVFNPLVKQEVYHYSYPVNYPGNEWSRINVGLALENYNQNIKDLYFRIVLLSVMSLIISVIVPMYLAKRLTAPILKLNKAAQKISDGDLDTRVNIKTENEIGQLAFTINRMAGSFKNSQDFWEKIIEEKTVELEKINKMLQIEIEEKKKAENTLKHYNIRLEALDKIYSGLTSLKSVEDIINETLSYLKKLFVVNSKSSITLFERMTDTAIIFSKKFNNGNADSISKVEIPLKENFNLVMEKEIQLKDFLRKNINNDFYNEIFFDDEMHSCISLPLLMDSQLIGVVTISSRELNSFNEEHKEVLSIVAHELAIAIYQALLQFKIKEHTKILQNSLSEKEVMLKEAHHRIKNNLQVISSLLYLNSKKIKDNEVLDIFQRQSEQSKIHCPYS